MSRLTIYAEGDADNVLADSKDFKEIQQMLGEAGVTLERWKADRELDDRADDDTILAAYQGEIDKLVADGGYQSYDVVSMNPDHPEKDAFRRKFLAEHRHSEDEIRFFCAWPRIVRDAHRRSGLLGVVRER